MLSGAGCEFVICSVLKKSVLNVVHGVS